MKIISKFDNMKMKKKFYFQSFFINFSYLLIASLLFSFLFMVDSNISSIKENQIIRINSLEEMGKRLYDFRFNLSQYIQADKEDEKIELKKNIIRGKDKIYQIIKSDELKGNKKLTEILDNYFEESTKIIQIKESADNQKINDFMSKEESLTFNNLNQIVSDSLTEEHNVQKTNLEKINQYIKKFMYIFGSVIAFLFLFVPLMSAFLSKRIIAPIREIIRNAESLIENKTDVKISFLDRKDEIGLAGQLIETMKDKMIHGTRIESALNTLSRSVMVFDHNNDLVYMNHSCTNIIKAHPDTFLRNFGIEVQQKEISPFNRHVLHKFLKIEDDMELKNHEIQMPLDNLVFKFIINNVFDEHEKRLGSVIELRERTEQVLIQRELSNTIEAAVRGDLNKRINIKTKDPLFTQLSSGINNFIETIKHVILDVNQALKAVAGGDLNMNISQEYKGVFNELKDGTNQTIHQLSTTVKDILDTSGHVASGVTEIYGRSKNVSQKAEHQSEIINSTAKVVEHIAGDISMTVKDARTADQLSRESYLLATEGGDIISNAIAAMERIKTSSEGVTKIVQVLNEIAFQTNLLALNASVEAARAGESGRGFAVVANEVRNLSQKAAVSAQQISDLIENSNEDIENGVILTSSSKETLEKMLQSAERVTQIVQNITHTCEKQIHSISNLKSEFSTINDIISQNTSMVDESAIIAKQVSEQSHKMSSKMKFFKL